MFKFFTSAIITLSILSLSACNTMEGMGQDIKNGGENLEKSAKKNK